MASDESLTFYHWCQALLKQIFLALAPGSKRSGELIKSTASLFGSGHSERNKSSYTLSILKPTIALKIYAYKADSNN